ATLSLALPAYMFPYAAMQLVSGGISDLTSRRWSILLGFGGYGLATLLSGLAPTYAVFLAAQVLQGITNAFTTPIALATLGDVVPPRQLGRAIGVMSSINVAGGMVAPLLAGALAGVSWRLVYVAIAGISWLAMAWCALWFRRYGDRVPARRRSHLRADLQALVSVLGLPMLLLASLAFLANAALMGPAYLFAEYLRFRWGTAVGQAGVILAMYGLAGLVTGPLAGMAIDRLGPHRTAVLSAAAVATTLALLGLAPGPALFAVDYFLVGVSGVTAWSALNTLVLQSAPSFRGTASSIFGSARFFAQGIAPAWFTPLYGAVGPRSIFFVAALLAAALVGPLAALRRPRLAR
ncbi:MAG: MFS transporter, partial [Thermomicrobiaceae bacterium]|nr:MFS transporter [Thermomicrobiaceae bacterium]